MTLQVHPPVFNVLPGWARSLGVTRDSRRIHLPRGAVLRTTGASPSYAHILESGLVASSIPFSNGRSMIVRTLAVGDLLEMDELLGSIRPQTFNRVLMAGIAVCVPFAVLRQALTLDSQLREDLLKKVGKGTLELEQLSICNRIHSLEQRLARHLYVLSERVGSTMLQLTQEDLADQLGVRRTSVVVAAGYLRDKGAIRFSRGSIAVLNKAILEEAACECHHALRQVQYLSTSLQRDTEKTAPSYASVA